MIIKLLYNDSSHFYFRQLTFGIGSHPQGSVSLLIILLIAIGLGLSVIALVGSAIYLPIRKRIQRRRGYEELSSSYPRIGWQERNLDLHRSIGSVIWILIGLHPFLDDLIVRVLSADWIWKCFFNFVSPVINGDVRYVN